MKEGDELQDTVLGQWLAELVEAQTTPELLIDEYDQWYSECPHIWDEELHDQVTIDLIASS